MMQLLVLVVALLLVHATQSVVMTRSEKAYWTARTKIISDETHLALGGDIALDSRELQANQTLMKYKETEWMVGFDKPAEYPPNMHFFRGKKAIDRSQMFKILKRMPKGVLLHTHEFGMVSYEYLFNLTYTEHLYICDDPTLGIKFVFLKRATDAQELCSNPNGWQLLADVRQESADDINERIHNTLSLVTHDPLNKYPTVNAVWRKFQSIFIKAGALLTYLPVFEKYFHQAFKELQDDHIMYVQIRTTLPYLYDLDGRIYKDAEVVKAFKNATENFKSANPDFIGAKIIYAPPRHVTNETMKQYVNIFTTIKSTYNDFVLGFDLVGQEDMGVPLKDFLKYLVPMKDKYNFFFHAGETDWYGSDTDENLIDAILLGTKRIGHGYALLKHPKLLELVRTEGIAVEVSPISNQVLNLVKNIRNHPGAVFSATNMPMVITNDDPSYWGAKGVSYDWYMAFMGMASRHSDLRYLKKLALNSIKYSTLDSPEKSVLLTKWNTDWQNFVRDLAADAIH